MKTILLVWSYCQNNFGDDMLFFIIEKILKEKLWDFKLNIISENASNPYSTDSKIQYILKRNLMGVIRAVISSDVVVVWPWSVFSWLFNPQKETLFVFYVSVFARFFFKKLIFLGIDYSPIQSKLFSFLSLFSLFLSDKIFVRFKQNYLKLDRYHMLWEKLQTINDLIFCNYTKELFYLGKSEYEKVKGQAMIVISDLSFSFHIESYEKFIASSIKLLQEKGYNVKILSLNMSSYGNKDTEYLKALSQNYSLSIPEGSFISFDTWNKENIASVFKLIWESEVVLSNKLHSHIVAAILWVNIISFSYHDKMRYLNHSIGLKEAFNFDINHITIENLEKYQSDFSQMLHVFIESEGINFDTLKVSQEISKNQEIIDQIKV